MSRNHSTVRWLLTIACAMALAGCQTQRGVYLRSSGTQSVELGASSAELPDGLIDYRIAPTDQLVVDVHRSTQALSVADFGDSILADFTLRSAQYRLVPGDSIGLSLQFESVKDFEVTVQPDGFLMLPRIGGSVLVEGLTLSEAKRLVTEKYSKVMTRPDITVYLLKSSGERVEKLSGKYEISRDGNILIPTLGAMSVLGLSSREVATLLSEKAVARYKNPIVVSASIAEPAASDTSILASADTRRYFSETIKVSADGSVFIPNVGRLDAAGKSLDELTAAVRQIVEKTYRNRTEVNIALGSSAGFAVYVAGEVRAPGRQTFQPQSTMLQVLAAAGWVNESGDLSRVSLIHRRGPGKYEVYTANLEEVYQRANAGFQDLRVSPQDMIVVPRTDIANANVVVDMYIRRMLPFGTSVSYTYVTGKSTTIP